MKYITLIVSLHVITFCWLCGVELGLAETSRDRVEVEQPYRQIMQEAVGDLQAWGYQVREPQNLPPVFLCGACLEKREAFGAYSETPDGIVVPDHFDPTTLDGHAALMHEYGHYLLTKAGVPVAEQEKLCLALGNSIYQKFFTAAAN